MTEHEWFFAAGVVALSALMIALLGFASLGR
jgi:hypothetical protein